MELTFNVKSNDGEIYQYTCKDTIFEYEKFRRILNESDCLTLISELKRLSKKKVAVIYGNCQTNTLVNFLSKNLAFCEEFFIIKLPALFAYDDNNIKYLDENFWILCDLFISQRVHKNNRFNEKLATKRFSQYLSEDSKIVWIPNMYFKGYFPQFVRNLDHNVDEEKIRGGRFPYGDKFVDEYVNTPPSTVSKVSIKKLEQYIQRQSFISADEIKKCVEHSFDELEKREWICDLKISDFIYDNYKRNHLFVSPEHPTPTVTLELTQRILKFIGISDMTFNEMDKLMIPIPELMQALPIYSKVQTVLGLKRIIQKAYPNPWCWNFHGNYVEYAVEYALTCWKNNIEN